MTDNSNANRSHDVFQLRPGTREELNKAKEAITKLFGLEKKPTHTALIRAGLKALVLLSRELKAPWGDDQKLAIWLALVGGLDLPADMDRSIGDWVLSEVLPKGGRS